MGSHARAAAIGSPVRVARQAAPLRVLRMDSQVWAAARREPLVRLAGMDSLARAAQRQDGLSRAEPRAAPELARRPAPRMPEVLPVVLGRGESTARAARPFGPAMAAACSTMAGGSELGVAATAWRTACESGSAAAPMAALRQRSRGATGEQRSCLVRVAGCASAAAAAD